MNNRHQGSLPARPGFDAAMAGKRAECDGGGLVAGGYAARQEFAGMLTGEYVDHGEPPWRWYLMVDLFRKPEGYPSDAVWCESASVFLLNDESEITKTKGPRNASEKS